MAPDVSIRMICPSFSILASFRSFRCGSEDKPSNQSIPRNPGFVPSISTRRLRRPHRQMSHTTDVTGKIVAPFRQFQLGTNAASVNLWFSRDTGFVSSRYVLRYRKAAHTIDTSRKTVASFRRFRLGNLGRETVRPPTERAIGCHLAFRHPQKSPFSNLRRPVPLNLSPD